MERVQTREDGRYGFGAKNLQKQFPKDVTWVTLGFIVDYHYELALVYG